MKIAVVGGGSTYSPELASGLAERAAALGLHTLALYDRDASRLATVGGFVERLCRGIAPELSVERHQELDAALSGARFVVVQIRVGGQAARREDELLGRSFGVIGQETTGVGGLAKALRTIPAVLEIARRVERVAPGALLINFTNPVSIVTQALLTHTAASAVGLCNIPIGQRRAIAEHLGVDPSEVIIDSVGLNHLSFIRGIEVGSREILPELIRGLTTTLPNGQRPANIPDLDFPAELFRDLGLIPSDYLRYFFLAKETIAEQAARPSTRADDVIAIEAELLAEYARPDRTTKPEALSRRGGAFYSHAALEIIEAVTHDTQARLVVDVANGSTVFELPREACVEVPCLVSATGARPLPQRPLEPVIRGLIQHVKAYEELAITAALSKSRRDIYRALVAHPLTTSAADAARIAERLAR
ncbi:MAG: 6-phospho-beta-glucosidase [Deltaproteobacteria bacterium]|nr:6-phospho-beta-glucosidase [Deltaproteobacteria bacterium]